MFKKQLLILFIICSSQYSLCFIDDAFTLVKKSWNFMLFVNDVQFSKDTLVSIKDLLVDNEDTGARTVQELTNINNKLDDLKAYSSDRFNRIDLLLNSLPDEIEIRAKKRDLVTFIAQTNAKWNSLMNFMNNTGSGGEYSYLMNVILATIGENLSKFRNDIAPTVSISSSDSGLFMAMAKHARDEIDVQCNQGETYHQTLVRLFQIVLTTEVKAHTLLSFAHRFVTGRSGGHLLFDAMKRDFKEQFSRYIHEFTESLNVILPYFRTCDPTGSWIRNVNYYELEGFSQRTIYYHPIPYAPRLDGNTFNLQNIFPRQISEHTACTGRLHHCSDYHKDWRYTYVCAWTDGPYKIRYVQQTDEHLGTDTANSCPEENLYTDSPWSTKIKDEFQECMCSTDKWKIVFEWQMSRTRDNYVVVGLRFRKLENYIFIQIAEAKLGPNGYISDFSWIPVSQVQQDRWSNALTVSLSMNRKAIFLDDLQLPAGCALTGIRFGAETRNGIEGFNIQIVGKKFDYRTGYLDLSGMTHIEPKGAAYRELTYQAKNPTTMNAREFHFPDSRGYDYINFRESDREADFGQSTLPLLDAVPVMTNPVSLIGGVGLFHKGVRGDAGFLSLRIYPIAYTHFTHNFLKSHNLNLASTWNN